MGVVGWTVKVTFLSIPVFINTARCEISNSLFVDIANYRLVCVTSNQTVIWVPGNVKAVLHKHLLSPRLSDVIRNPMKIRLISDLS